AMTNHWRDIRHADLVMINGANPAEAHPVGFQWMLRAKLERGAKMIHVDPRFTRTSAVADRHLRIRTGTDVAYFGGLINYVLQNNLYHKEYVQFATNAGLVVKDGDSLTHHTTGVQLIRSGALLQLLLGNMGRPGGGMNAERGHANIQGNTDHAISWEILPGYLKIPAPGQRNLNDYIAQSASKKLVANS